MVQTSIVRNGTLVKPPTFTSVEAERRHRKERLAAALRIFARLGFAQGLGGHITVRDPELTDHFWVNPFGTGLTQLAQCDRILVVHKYYIKVVYPKEIDEISNSNRLC